MKENHFNPGLYGDCPKVEKPIDKMTFGEALAIVLAQARESDFHDEVVEQACQMTEYHHKLLSCEAYIQRSLTVSEDEPKGFVEEGSKYIIAD